MKIRNTKKIIRYLRVQNEKCDKGIHVFSEWYCINSRYDERHCIFCLKRDIKKIK